MKIYEMEEKKQSFEKKIAIMSLVFLNLLLVVAWFVYNNPQITSSDESIKSVILFYVGFMVFMDIIVPIRISRMKGNYFVIEGDILSFYKVGTLKKQHNIKTSTFNIEKQRKKVEGIKVADLVSLAVFDEKGRAGTYKLEILGAQKFYELVEDINKLKETSN